MHKLLIPLLLLITILSTEPIQAQSNIKTLYALAKQAKANGENIKAIGYFEELYSKTSSESYYLELVALYSQEEDYSSAEKIIKKRIKKYSNRPDLLLIEVISISFKIVKKKPKSIIILLFQKSTIVLMKSKELLINSLNIMLLNLLKRFI